MPADLRHHRRQHLQVLRAQPFAKMRLHGRDVPREDRRQHILPLARDPSDRAPLILRRRSARDETDILDTVTDQVDLLLGLTPSSQKGSLPWCDSLATGSRRERHRLDVGAG